MKGCYEAFHIKELLVMRGQSIAFEQAYEVPFHVGECSTLRNCLLLRLAYTFYITCICTCFPIAVVKKDKIILFDQKRCIDSEKSQMLAYSHLSVGLRF